MKNKFKYLLLPAMLLLFAGFFPADNDVFFKISKSIDIFGKVYKEVSFNYVDEIDPEEFMLSGINGMLSSLDPYTVFIDEKRKDDIDLLTNGKYGGIGVSIGIRNERVTIVDILDGYAAQRQGLRIGDIILKVNNVEINKNNFDEISSFVKGDPGTAVKITILRDATTTLDFDLIREEVRIKNVTFSGFYPENSNNVYMKLVSFTRTAGDEVKNALTNLKAEKNINSIVLDLRGNPGGLLDAAVDVCEKFLKKNQLIVSVLGRDTTGEKKYLSTEEPVSGNTKLVVLVDSGSASASEIVAGAIQDHDRGVILGTETFGKGLVQTVVPLTYNTSLKITTAKYFTPSGRCIQKIDYAKGNKLFNDNHVINEKEYNTDNKRRVYASGGIKPDTAINNIKEPGVVIELASKGVFFKFANKFAAKNSKDDFAKYSDDKLYNEFTNFVNDEKFIFNTVAERQLNSLIAVVESEQYSNKILDELNSIGSKFREMRAHELDNHKDDIVEAIRSELMIRYDGMTGRIKEMLKHDTQFATAVKVLSDEKIYNRLLRNN